MREPGYPGALRVLREVTGGDLNQVLAAACEPVPAWDPVVYLADFSGEVLLPLAPEVAEEAVAGSMAGRTFTTGQPVTSERDGAVRVWVPVTEQASRTGVLAITVPQASPRPWSKPSCSACSPGWSSPLWHGSAMSLTSGGRSRACRCRRPCSGTCCRRWTPATPGRA